jgi:hypothetical protein
LLSPTFTDALGAKHRYLWQIKSRFCPSWYLSNYKDGLAIKKIANPLARTL